MAALTATRSTLERESPHGQTFHITGADSTQFYQGGLVALNATTKRLQPMTAAAGLVCVGRCEETVLTGASNTRKIRVRSGCFKWNNADLVAATDAGELASCTDDNTVRRTAAGSSIVGSVLEIEADGAWVLTIYPPPAAGAAAA